MIDNFVAHDNLIRLMHRNNRQNIRIIGGDYENNRAGLLA